MTSSAKSRVLAFVAFGAIAPPVHTAWAQQTPTLETLPAAAQWTRECGAAEASPMPDSALIALRGRNGAVLTGLVADSAGKPVRDVHITFAGVKGEWRGDMAGGFTIRGIPPGPRAVRISATGFLNECRVVNFIVRDTATLAVSLMRGHKPDGH